MDAREDTVGSAKPPKPPSSPDSERWTALLLPVIAIAAVAAAAFSGITAWETHQERVNSKAFYCALASDPGPDPSQQELADQQEFSNEVGC